MNEAGLTLTQEKDGISIEKGKTTSMPLCEQKRIGAQAIVARKVPPTPSKFVLQASIRKNTTLIFPTKQPRKGTLRLERQTRHNC